MNYEAELDEALLAGVVDGAVRVETGGQDGKDAAKRGVGGHG